MSTLIRHLFPDRGYGEFVNKDRQPGLGPAIQDPRQGFRLGAIF
jgi:hypothetical protein